MGSRVKTFNLESGPLAYYGGIPDSQHNPLNLYLIIYVEYWCLALQVSISDSYFNYFRNGQENKQF